MEKGEKEGVRLPFSSQSSLHPCKLVHWVKQAEAFVGSRLASNFNFNLSVLPQSLYLCNFCTLWEDMQDRDVVQCNWSRFSLSAVQCRSCWIGDVDGFGWLVVKDGKGFSSRQTTCSSPSCILDGRPHPRPHVSARTQSTWAWCDGQHELQKYIAHRLRGEGWSTPIGRLSHKHQY